MSEGETDHQWPMVWGGQTGNKVFSFYCASSQLEKILFWAWCGATRVARTCSASEGGRGRFASDWSIGAGGPPSAGARRRGESRRRAPSRLTIKLVVIDGTIPDGRRHRPTLTQYQYTDRQTRKPIRALKHRRNMQRRSRQRMNHQHNHTPLNIANAPLTQSI